MFFQEAASYTTINQAASYTSINQRHLKRRQLDNRGWQDFTTIEGRSPVTVEEDKVTPPSDIETAESLCNSPDRTDVVDLSQ